MGARLVVGVGCREVFLAGKNLRKGNCSDLDTQYFGMILGGVRAWIRVTESGRHASIH